MSEVIPREQIVFPPFRLDLAAGRLVCGTNPIELPPKPFGVLRYLAERPGRLITKEELLSAVWPDVHVNHDVLKVTISEIRRALDDQSRDPRFIETAHRRGYRFIGRTEHLVRQDLEIDAAAAPKTRYARSGDIDIAYQVLGDGPIDLVFVMGWVSHLDYFWTEPSFARFLRRLASFSRLILFDKRGTGLSDRIPVDSLPTLEQRMDDVRAVMDAAGSRRAVICGISEGGTMSALFAATYPERTSGLVMIGSYAKRIRGDGYPWGPTPEQREQFLTEIRDQWGGPVGLYERAPSMASDTRFRQWWAGYLRTAASPAAAVALTRMNSEADIRPILPAIRVPTLVIHRSGDKCLRVEEGRYLASRIPSAQFVEKPGVDHLPFVGDQDGILNEIEHFLNSTRPTPRAEPVLATVMAASFTLSEENESRVYARRRLWDHIRRELQWFRGLEWGSGHHSLLASFDGPARAVRCACAIAQHASRVGIHLTAGLHVGQCEMSRRELRGPAVDVARQISASAAQDELLASSVVRDLVAGSGIEFAPRAAIIMTGSSESLALLSIERVAARRADSQDRRNFTFS